MEGIKGLYTVIQSIIHEKEIENHLSISVDDMVKRIKSSKDVDVYSASLDWYIEFALKAAIATSLNQAGYRSVLKGDGFYVNPDNCTKPEYWAELLKNAELEELQKAQVFNYLTNKSQELANNGQLSFDPKTGKITEDVTRDELLEMLKKDAGIA